MEAFACPHDIVFTRRILLRYRPSNHRWDSGTSRPTINYTLSPKPHCPRPILESSQTPNNAAASVSTRAHDTRIPNYGCSADMGNFFKGQGEAAVPGPLSASASC